MKSGAAVPRPFWAAADKHETQKNLGARAPNPRPSGAFVFLDRAVPACLLIAKAAIQKVIISVIASRGNQ